MLEAYSLAVVELTVLYAVPLRSSWCILIFRLRNPKVLFAILGTLDMCVFQERF